MKNLTKKLFLFFPKKLLLPLTFSTICAFTQAQDVIKRDTIKISKEIIKDYYENREVLSKKIFYNTPNEEFYAAFYCDINKDKRYDIVEVYNIKINEQGILEVEKDSLGNIENPWGFILKNHEKNYEEFFFEFPDRDRLNGNEIFHKRFEKKEFDKDSFNL